MTSHDFDKSRYSDSYLDARKHLDDLCEKIRRRELSSEEALGRYQMIERDFLKEEPQKAELFIMIYRNRIKRLTGQFPPVTGNES